MAGKGTPATALLAKQRVTHQVHSYDHGAGQAYGPEAAERLGLDPERVFKTLVAEVDGTLTVGVVPVSATLDLKALAAAVGGKRARMADVAAAERATGYVAGGISPLGQRKRLPTVIDVHSGDRAHHVATVHSAGRVHRAPVVCTVRGGRGRLCPRRLGPRQQLLQPCGDRCA